MLTARTDLKNKASKHFIWSGPDKENPVEIAAYDGRKETLEVNTSCLFSGSTALSMEQRMERSEYACAWKLLLETFPNVFAAPPMERAFQPIEGGF